MAYTLDAPSRAAEMNAPFFRTPPLRDRKWLDFLQTQPCIVTGLKGAEPAHLRLLGAGGTGVKPPDNLVLPLHHELHRRQSTEGEGAVWLWCANEYPEFYFRLLRDEAKRRYQMWRAE